LICALGLGVKHHSTIPTSKAFSEDRSAFQAVPPKDHNAEICRELHRILRCDPFTVKGASQLLQLSSDAEESQVKKAKEYLKQKLAKAQLQAWNGFGWEGSLVQNLRPS
jgi:hypothetical protein